VRRDVRGMTHELPIERGGYRMVQQQQTGSASSYRSEPQPTGWVGWVIFAGILMFMIGSFNALAGIVALFNDEYYLVSQDGLLIEVDYSAWGWGLLLYGIALGIAGWGVVVGQTWARVVAIILVAINALVNLAFLSAQPVWTTIVIALDVIVIYALVVHGREAKALR